VSAHASVKKKGPCEWGLLRSAIQNAGGGYLFSEALHGSHLSGEWRRQAVWSWRDALLPELTNRPRGFGNLTRISLAIRDD
jgi:hypothetical protein